MMRKNVPQEDENSSLMNNTQHIDEKSSTSTTIEMGSELEAFSAPPILAEMDSPLSSDDETIKIVTHGIPKNAQSNAPLFYKTNENTCCNGRYWCISSDCCGMVGVSFTYAIIFFAEYIVVVMLLNIFQNFTFLTFLNFVVFQCIVGLAVASHLKTMLTDPGAVPANDFTDEHLERLRSEMSSPYHQHSSGANAANPIQRVIVKCAKCSSVKPSRAHHCSVCRRCIRKMDHHCPWVNNCIGEGNQKYFILFNFYIFLMSVYTLVLISFRFVDCSQSEFRSCSTPLFSATTLLIHIIFLTFIALLFAIFTMIMTGTQISAVWSDTTGIESIKNEANVTYTRNLRWKAVEAVMGKFSLITWLSPFAPVRKCNKSHSFMFSV